MPRRRSLSWSSALSYSPPCGQTCADEMPAAPSGLRLWNAAGRMAGFLFQDSVSCVSNIRKHRAKLNRSGCEWASQASAFTRAPSLAISGVANGFVSIVLPTAISSRAVKVVGVMIALSSRMLAKMIMISALV